jgi:hypothetical protein
METGSILIKESMNALQNVRQGVSKCFGVQALELRGLREFIEIYIDNEVYSLLYISNQPIGGQWARINLHWPKKPVPKYIMVNLKKIKKWN